MRDGRWVPPERILPLAPLTLLLAELKGFLSTRGQGACGELLFWSPLRARTRTHAHTQTHTHKHTNTHTPHTLHLDALTWMVRIQRGPKLAALASVRTWAPKPSRVSHSGPVA